MCGRQRKPYTGFGRTLRRLMTERDIRSWTQMEEKIKEATGRSYSHQSMSKYASGISTVPPEFVRDVCATLDLGAEERTELAERYAYESLPPDAEAESA